jgi:hypothetical protein
MGDFFIKFCESGITKKDLISKVDKYITFKGDVKKGEWDVCPGDKNKVQSRIGPYITITKLVK